MKIKKIASVSFLALVAPVLTLAQVGNTGVPGYTPVNTQSIGSAQGLVDKIGLLATYFGMVLMAISVIMILYAAFKFITANGDAAAVGSARTTLIWALVGVAVALLAFALPGAVRYLLPN